MRPNNFDPIADRSRGIIQQRRPAPAEVAAEYTDAELYRIVVAQALRRSPMGPFQQKPSSMPLCERLAM
jgi:hypothetical protein